MCHQNTYISTLNIYKYFLKEIWTPIIMNEMMSKCIFNIL